MVFIFLLNNNEMGKGVPERHLAPSSYETSAPHCKFILWILFWLFLNEWKSESNL